MEARRWKEEGTLQEAAARTVSAVDPDLEALPLLDMARVFRSQETITTQTQPPLHFLYIAIMKSIFSSLALFMSCAEALYFYIDGPSQKCFFEELPKDTLVVGKKQQEWLEKVDID